MIEVRDVTKRYGAFVALEHDLLVPYARRVFDTYWGDLQDISRDDVLLPIVAAVGLDAGEFQHKINDSLYKDRLRANTDELMARGGFGSPSIFIDDTDMYFGNDRLALVDYRLAGRPPRGSPGAPYQQGEGSATPAAAGPQPAPPKARG